MDVNSASADILKQAVFELVADCRNRLGQGPVDVSQVGRGVQAYCHALSQLPAEEARRHREDLEAMMQAIKELGEELVSAREAIRAELESLGRRQRAHVAYQRSDAIGEKKIRESD